jgi:hypothetical protein
VFREELKENAKLRAWWEKGDMAKEGPKIEDALEKIYELSQYLGDEIVVGAAPSTAKRIRSSSSLPKCGSLVSRTSCRRYSRILRKNRRRPFEC